MGIFSRLEQQWGVPAERVNASHSVVLYCGRLQIARAYDGKAKVWSIDQRSCLATHSETNKILWSVRWLPKTGKSEGFATAGANRSISFYREAIGL